MNVARPSIFYGNNDGVVSDLRRFELCRMPHLFGIIQTKLTLVSICGICFLWGNVYEAYLTDNYNIIVTDLYEVPHT